jgi:hypothetical protein
MQNTVSNMKNIVALLLILLVAKNVSSQTQEDSRYKTPSSVRLINYDKLQTHAKLYLIEGGVLGVVGGSCLAAGLVKANKAPDYSAHFNKEQRVQYAKRWDRNGKILIGVGAGSLAVSAILTTLGIKCIHDIKTRYPHYKLRLELGAIDNGAGASLTF